MRCLHALGKINSTIGLFLLIASASASEREMIADGSEKYEVEWTITERFDGENWAERWFVETQGPQVFSKDGKLQVRQENDDRNHAGVTIWLREKLPQDVVIRVKASNAPVVENNACNLNFFIHATEADGSPLRFGRDAAYDNYHVLPNYIFTFTGGVTPGWVRARLNPGFQLLHENDKIRSEPGRSYEFLILVQNGRLRYFINGVKHHDVQTKALPGGWFGLRTWFSSVDYEEVQIGRLVKPAQS